MASRIFKRNVGHLSNELDFLFCTFSITGASGAVVFGATEQAKSLGITSVAKSATGRYLITLTDSYNLLLNAAVSFEHATSAPGVLSSVLRTSDVKTAKTVTISTMAVADTEANPTDTTVVRVTLKLRNSVQ